MSVGAESKAHLPLAEPVSGETVTAAGRTARWFKVLSEGRGAQTTRLFCFPFAGGGASAFAKWASGFPPHVSVCSIQYPGREDRWGEPPFASLEALVEALAEALAPHLTGRFALLGHSFGALVAYELTRALQRQGRPTPLRLFVSGARAPHLPPKEPIHELPERDFLKKLCEFNGMPDEVLRNTDLLLAVLPIIRADFRLFEQYRFGDATPLPVPISAFGGASDASVPIADLLAWSSRTSKVFRSRFLEGHHFFLFDSPSKTMSYIVEDIEAAAGDSNRSS
jgi:medium-chain acyl-[acyl-carrier-protein] hydrolase